MKLFSLTTTVLSCKWVILMALVFSITNGHAQNEQVSNPTLVGSWTLDSTSSLAGMAQEDKELLDTSPQVRSQLLQTMTNRTLVFNLDGSFYQVDGKGNQMGGTWGLQGQVLTVRSTSGNLWVQQVLQLSHNQLALGQRPKENATPMLPILYLTKNQ